MSIEATAEALAPETVAPVQNEPEVSTEDEMGAVWDKLNTEEPDDQTPDEPVEEAQVADEPVEEPAPKVEIPSDIPRQLKAHWDKMPEDARTSVEDFARETNRKLSEQGRLIQGISPIRDALTEAVKEFPQMNGMKPAEIAQEVFQLARTSAEFNANPVKAMMGLIDKHGIREQMQKVLSGQPAQDSVTPLKQQINTLQRQLSQYADPEFIRSQVTAVTSEQATLSEVQRFAASAPNWADVEDRLPPYVEFMRAEKGPDASAKDVLQAAYDLAVSRIMPSETKAPEPVAEIATNVVDPEKAKAALKAKSVNVRSQPSKTRTLTEDELLSSVYDSSQKR